MASDVEMDQDSALEVMSPQPQSTLVMALHSCVWCKRTKKKCDRTLPGCSQCIGKARECTYNDDGRDYINPTIVRPAQRLKTSHSGSSPAAPRHIAVTSHHAFRSSTLGASTSAAQERTSEHRIRRLDFPAAVFLDWDLFKQCQLDIPKATVPLPSWVTDRLGDASNVENIANDFFESIHTWMPIVSKKRYLEQLANPTTRDYADLALLTLCMKLSISVPPYGDRDGQTTLYLASKRYASNVESTGIMTIKTLQAHLLITLYEIGHGIYPSAFLSLGACVREGQALGIQWDENGKDSKTILNRVTSWVQLEEQHRVWWAVVILDRYMSIGCPQRALSVKNPSEKIMYPANDQQWDEGIMPSRRIFGLSAAMAYELDGFAVIARSAVLLGQVLNDHATIDPQSKNKSVADAMALASTLRGLISDESGSGVPLHQQSAFCISALLLLQQLYQPRTGLNTALTDTLKVDYSTIMSTMIMRGDDEEIPTCPPGEICEDGGCPKHLSPWVLSSIYSTISVTIRLLGEMGPEGEGDDDENEESAEKKYEDNRPLAAPGGVGGEGKLENGVNGVDNGVDKVDDDEVDDEILGGSSHRQEHEEKELQTSRMTRQQLKDTIVRLKGKMEVLRGRWMLGNTYLELMEAREVASYR